jgi:hypothetical protein
MVEFLRVSLKPSEPKAKPERFCTLVDLHRSCWTFAIVPDRNNIPVAGKAGFFNRSLGWLCNLFRGVSIWLCNFAERVVLKLFLFFLFTGGFLFLTNISTFGRFFLLRHS